MLNPLLEDKDDRIQENKIIQESEAQNPTTSCCDFGGYFSVEDFTSNTAGCIQRLFGHIITKSRKLDPDSSLEIKGGDDLSSYCYGDHKKFIFSD